MVKFNVDTIDVVNSYDEKVGKITYSPSSGCFLFSPDQYENFSGQELSLIAAELDRMNSDL